MNRLHARFLIGASFVCLLGVAPSAGSAQTTFTACRVPVVGVLYLLAAPADPCLDAAHVKFSWTDGGAPADGSITSAKIADGTIVAADIAVDGVTGAAIAPAAVGSTEILDGSIQTADVANGAITQAKLDAAVSFPLADGAVTSLKIADGTIAAVDHAAGSVTTTQILDGTIAAVDLSAAAINNAHLGTGTASAGTFLRGDRTWAPAEKVTRIEYSGSTTATGASPAVLFRTIGTFTKDAASTGITVTWTGHISQAAGNLCEMEVRVDNTVPTGATNFWGSIVYAAEQAVSLTAYWAGLTTGTHTISLWHRGFATSCTENNGNFRPSVLVFER